MRVLFHATSRWDLAPLPAEGGALSADKAEPLPPGPTRQ